MAGDGEEKWRNYKVNMKEKIREIVSKEYDNTLGIVMYKNNQKVYEEYFSGAEEAKTGGKGA